MAYRFFDNMEICSMKGCFLIIFTVVLVGCNEGNRAPVASEISEEPIPAIVFHPSHEPRKKNAPFSDAVQVGNIYFLSGQIGMDHRTRTLVDGGIAAETEQTLRNIEAVLNHHNLGLEHIVKVTVILDDIADFGAFNEIYVHYLPQKPARTTFAAQSLAAGAKIEIEVVAVAP